MTSLSGYNTNSYNIDNIVGLRGRCVKHWSRTPADPGSIPGAGDKDKGLIYLPCNIGRCAPRG